MSEQKQQERKLSEVLTEETWTKDRYDYFEPGQPTKFCLMGGLLESMGTNIDAIYAICDCCDKGEAEIKYRDLGQQMLGIIRDVLPPDDPRTKLAEPEDFNDDPATTFEEIRTVAKEYDRRKELGLL